MVPRMRRWLALAIVAGCSQSSPPGSDPDADVPEAPDATAPDAAAPDAAPVDPTLYPDPDWPTGDPVAAGLDPAKLEEAAGIAEGNGSRCLLVIRHGRLVFERYFNGADATTRSQSWSLAKSYTATLVGIAIDRGDLGGLDDRVADYVPQWQGTPLADITLRDLVSMTSGLQWSAFQDYIQMALFAQD